MRVIAFHAHPDDEALLTGGVLARAARHGAHIEVVFATSGERGDRHGKPDATDAELQLTREAEAMAAAALLGMSRCHFLRLPDSGWKGSAAGAPADCLARRDAREVASLAAAACLARPADVLLAPDASGTYGHPDHIKVFEAARWLAGAGYVKVALAASLNREHLLETLPSSHTARPFIDARPLLGLPAESAGTAANVRMEVGPKRDAMLAHASQLRPGSLLWTFADLRDEQFELALGYEWLAWLGDAETPHAHRRAAELLGLQEGATITRAVRP